MKKEGGCVYVCQMGKENKEKKKQRKPKEQMNKIYKKKMNIKRKGQNDITTIKMLKEMVLHLFKLWP